MGSQEFIVLYTHQKTKKSKVWQDGVLKISPLGSKAILCDVKGQCLESLFLKCLEVKPGDELESDRYLITIEEVQGVGNTALKQKAIPEAPASTPRRFTSCGRSLGCQPAGLKRKSTGFQGPRQVAKKVTVIESVELTPSLETVRSSPASLSPLCSTSALFATTGNRDAQSMPACPEVSVACKNTERGGMLFPSVVSHPRLKTSTETSLEDGDCPCPVSSVSPHSDSWSSNKATTKNFLASHDLGVTQSIRSKAQIVALLKSKSVGMCNELNSGIPEVFSQIYPQASLKIPAEPNPSGEWGEQTEVKSTESSRSHQPGSSMGARSRWAAYLPSHRSPVGSFSESGGDAESRPHAREDDTIDFTLEGAWGEKRAQLFETCTQEGSRYIGGRPVSKIDHSEAQEVEIPSFCGTNNLPVDCSSEESNGLLSEPDLQGKTEIPTHQNVQMFVTESFLTREDAQEPVSGAPEKEQQQPGLYPSEPAPLQTRSPLNSSQVSDDIVGILSKSRTGIEDQESAPEPGDSGAQPLVEVTFDLNTFETSDTEEESQESGRASQYSEGGPRASWAIGGNAGVHRRGEDVIFEEVGRGCEPLSPSVGDKPAEPLLSQFCDDIHAGFDTGPRKARATNRDTEEDCREKRSHSDSSLEWPENAYAENREEALGRPTTKDAADEDSTVLPNTSSRLDTSLQHKPRYLNTPPHQNPENDLLSEQAQPQPFILGNRLARKPLTPVLPESVPQSQLSQDSQEMVRENEVESKGPHPSLQVLGSEGGPAFWTEIPKQVERKPCDPQFPDKENFPRGDTTFQTEDNFQAMSQSDTNSVENDIIRESSCLVNQDPWRLPLVRLPRRPLVTLPPAEGPTDIAPCSHSMACDFEFQAASAAPTLSLCEEPAPLVFSARPEHFCEESFSQESRGAAPADVSRLHKASTGSKWLKYQSVTPGNLTAVDRLGGMGAPGSQPGEWPCVPEHRQGDAANRSHLDSVPMQLIRDELGHQQQACGSPDPISRRKFPKVLEQSTGVRVLQEVNGAALCFPSGQDIQSVCLPQRQIHIPAEFQSPAHYKQVFTSCLIEHLNILLFELAQRLHRALAKVDISFYTSAKERPRTGEHTGPSCHHQQPAKLVAVRKEGPNKGRLFYTCDAPKADRCQFFKWLEAMTPGPSLQGQSLPSRVLSDIKSIGLYLRSQKIPVYEECHLLIRKGFDLQRKKYSKLKKFAAANPDFYNEPKSRLYLKLSRKESSSTYSKDDLWVVSKTLDFELDTFIACSAFFGPSSANEVEIVPLRGYFPSNWPLSTVVHAMLVCNASTELTTLKNIQDHFSPVTLPITQHLLTMTSSSAVSNTRTEKRRFIPPSSSIINRKYELLSLEPTLQLARDFIQAHRLNEDQARALGQIAHMMASHSSADETQRPLASPLPITIIHGVFGAGKSYLLAVVILFFVQLFEKSETPTAKNARPWKLLISSSTNVAVDRVLLGLLSLGFEKFIRVGSVRKIARPVLPYSLHAGSENETEQLKELHALMKEDLTPMERVYVRRSIEQHRLGTNRALLKQVCVVGVTCAACPFPCLNELRFPVVVLDECSQITEPAALLPIARFECEKLVLVGDPKQLPPTIQGSDAAHQSGLEQTLFDRLCLMGHQPVLLRTQYRCHPAISALANDLFYEGSLLDGVRAAERGPLLSWLPTLCFYNVKGLEQIERDNSFHNVAEAVFTLKLIQSLLASGVSGAVIGVITLYKSQMYKLCHLLAGAATELPDTKAVQVSTVDAFQGAEKEVIILSCVRTRQVGFIDSEKRVNVALTRGRRHLLIVGSLACLQKNRLWARVIQHCEGREDGLQHASQCEPQLDRLLRAYCEKQAEEKQKKKKDTVS